MRQSCSAAAVRPTSIAAKLADAGADNRVLWLKSETEADVLAEMEALAKALF